MSECPYCQCVIDENVKFNFCPNCEKQIRCKECGEYLLPNKGICLFCGEPVGSGKSQRADETPNRYYYEEHISQTSSTRKIELSLTDNAIEKAVPLFGSQLPLRKINIEENIEGIKETPLLEEPLEEDKSSYAEDNSASGTDGLSSNEYYVVDKDGYLVFRYKDFKGQDRKNQQIRFIVAYAWCYEKAVKLPLPKDHISEAAKRNQIHDTNFRIYYQQAIKEYMLEVNEGLHLKHEGNALAKKVLDEMVDETKSGYAYWDGGKPRAKRSGMNKKDSELIDEWIALPAPYENFDIRNIASTINICMFIFYELTKKLKVAHAIKPGMAFEYAIKRYKTISFSKDSFTRTLSRPEYKGKFNRTNDGLYFLTPEAETEVEKSILKI